MKTVKQWVGLGLLVTTVDQFLFVCLSWLAFADLPVRVASGALSAISATRILGLVLFPVLAKRITALSVCRLGLLGRMLAFSLLLAVFYFPVSPLVTLMVLMGFALSDGIFIPASSAVLRTISAGNDYVSALALTQIALNIALAVAAVAGGVAIAYLPKLLIVALLLLSSIGVIGYFQLIGRTLKTNFTFTAGGAVSRFESVKTIFGSAKVLKYLLYIVAVELCASGVLNVLFPYIFTTKAYTSISFGIGIGLFVCGGVAVGLGLYRYPKITQTKYYFPICLSLLALAFGVMVADRFPAYLLAFLMIGATAALLAPFLTNSLVTEIKSENHEVLFTFLSISSYGSIFIAYPLAGFLVTVMKPGTIFITLVIIFLGLALYDLSTRIASSENKK